MKKLFLVLSTAGIFAVSNAAISSDKALASAWTGLSGSIAKFVKSTNLRASATPVPASVAGTSEARTPRGEWQALKTVFALPDFGVKEVAGSACPLCPQPPCD